MHKKFDHRTIEKKWQEIWKREGVHDADERDPSKEKEYVLVEWPYPSGNLHIGHWYAFAVPDIYVRRKRMEGKQVLFPMGFDAFGLPAENAAIKRNVNPNEWTDENIAHMKDQLMSMGNAFSWDKTANSTDPDYYRWTQWMFTKFFEHGIAYRGKGTVNWCPSCNTVLANEQVTNDGHCERCGTEIEKREMDEWKMRITDYADRLIDDLEPLDWPEHIKEAQRRWIGRSQGSLLDFEVKSQGSPQEAGQSSLQGREVKGEIQRVKVFTTRPDTLYGATYLVLAPEHSLVNKLKKQIENWDEVAAYVKRAGKESEQDRLDETREKTGVKLKGVTAVNPGNGEEIPVYIADYVLAHYGTGAIMAVPAHDERDYEFAIQHALPVLQVIANYRDPDEPEGKISGKSDMPFTGEGTLINSNEFDGMDSEEAKAAVTKKVGGEVTNTYKLRDWSVGRQRYWGVPIPIVYDPEGTSHPVPEEHLPWLLPEDVDFRPTGEPPLAKSKELKERTERIFGTGWTPEVETMDTFVDSSWYYLRYIDNRNNESFSSRKRQEEWMPVDIYFGGAEHTTMHLLYSRFWQKALLDLELVRDSEPYVRRINRGLVLGPDGNKMSKSKGNVVDPDEQVDRLGADAVKMYLAFIGPYGETANYPYDLGGIAGIRRFLEHVYGLSGHVQDTESEAVTRQLHKTMKKVGTDVEQFKFNTAISAMMVFLNVAEKEGLTKDSYDLFLRLLAPFAPHLAEELWREDHDTSIHQEAAPAHDDSLVADATVMIGVQVNGKFRGTIELQPDAGKEDALEAARAEPALRKHLAVEPAKIIYVPGRILNIIAGD